MRPPIYILALVICKFLFFHTTADQYFILFEKFLNIFKMPSEIFN